jgi:hypothetical protein
MTSARSAAPVMSRAVSVAHIWIFVAIVAAALIERALIDTAPDVSWLLTLGEKMLAGARPYVDFIEVNPPASIYVYLPAILLSRLTGVSPEFAVGLLVFAGVAASLWISARIVVEAGIVRAENAWPIAAVLAAMLLVLPAAAFGQREHIALITFLPMLAVATLRAQRKPVTLRWIIVAGVGAAVTAVIKPHFICPVVFVAATAAICARSWRPVLAPENWISAGLVILYAAAVVIAYPEFVFDLVPIIMAVYVSQKASWADLLTFGAIPFWCGGLAAIVLLKRRAAFRPPFVLLTAASAGFLISFALQQKGVAYHSYPALALIFSAAVIAMFDRAPAAKPEWFGFLGNGLAVIGLAGIIGSTFSWYAVSADLHSLIAPIRASVSRPTVLNISGGGVEGMGFPLTRQLGGTWVGHTCGQWITAGAMAEKMEGANAATAAILDRYIARDRTVLTEDIERNKPDIILVDRIHYDWLKWAQTDPALARELTGYHELVSAHGILVLRRNGT